MLGIHVRKLALCLLLDSGGGASCLYQRSTIRRDQSLGDNTPLIIVATGGKRSCPKTGPASPFILLDSEATYKLTGGQDWQYLASCREPHP